MWTCPRCGRSFANRNQQHACGPLDLDRHLAGKDPEVVAIFGRLVTLAGSGHLPQARDPVKVNLLIREFVESLGGTAR